MFNRNPGGCKFKNPEIYIPFHIDLLHLLPPPTISQRREVIVWLMFFITAEPQYNLVYNEATPLSLVEVVWKLFYFSLLLLPFFMPLNKQSYVTFTFLGHVS